MLWRIKYLISRKIIQNIKNSNLSDNEYVGAYRALVNSFLSGFTNYNTTRMMMSTELGLDPEERVKHIAKNQAYIRGLKKTEDLDKFFKAEGFGEAFKIAALNPLDVIAPLTVESLAQFLPAYLNIAPSYSRCKRYCWCSHWISRPWCWNGRWSYCRIDSGKYFCCWSG